MTHRPAWTYGARSKTVPPRRAIGWRKAARTGVLAGLVAMMLSIDLGAHLFAAGYRLASGRPIPSAALNSFADFIGGPGAVLLLGVVTALSWGFAERVSRRTQWKSSIVCGVAAALTAVAMILLRWPPVLLWEIASYHLAGISGGIAGVALGRLFYRWLRAEEEIIRRAQRRLAEAREADEVAEILGVELGGKSATGLMLLLDDLVLGTWTKNEGLNTIQLLSTIPEQRPVFDDPWMLLQVKSRQDASCVLLVPLIKAGDGREGALAVWFVGRCPYRVRRRFLVTAPAAGLALRVRENERRVTTMEGQRRFARVMHDGCKQDLLGAELHLALVRQHLEKGEFESALDNLRFAEGGVRRAREETNALVHELRPMNIVNDCRLGERLAALGERMARENGLRVLVSTEGAPNSLSSIVAEELVWVAREAMANVVRHARATEARVRLLHTSDAVALEVRDNGIGFDLATATTPENSYGLTNMRERTEELGGKLLVDSSPGTGTNILAAVPASGRWERQRKSAAMDT